MSCKKDIDELNREFSDFFEICKQLSKNEVKDACEPLYRKFRWIFWKRVLFAVGVFLTIFWMYKNIDFFSWILAAIGRLLLIKLRPIWNWESLYDAKCLVREFSENTNIRSPAKFSNDANSKDCFLCESFQSIEFISNTTFIQIQENFLERGLPVIITDCGLHRNIENFIEEIKLSNEFIETNPCNVESSFLLSRLANLADMIGKYFNSHGPSASWWFHIRNCDFKAVKASRKFIRKPYFYPPHLAPFYSSWLLVSVNFEVLDKDLYIDGLIIVQVITGELFVQLKAKEPCWKRCKSHEIKLWEGEAIVFSTDLWDFAYSTKYNVVAAATITETHWD